MQLTRGVVEALRDDPDVAVLTERLAGELALARVTEQALLARRTLLAGMREPNIVNVKEAQESLGKTTAQLDEELSQQAGTRFPPGTDAQYRQPDPATQTAARPASGAGSGSAGRQRPPSAQPQ